MDPAQTPRPEAAFETGRLLLRPLRVSDAAVQHELWTERDPRVPPHRRISPDGHPTLEEIADGIRRDDGLPFPGLLAAEQKSSGQVIGYCGLIPNRHGQDGEPELAFEFLRRVWGRGLASEASRAVLQQAQAAGYPLPLGHRPRLEHPVTPRPGQTWLRRNRPGGPGRRARRLPLHPEDALSPPVSSAARLAVRRARLWP
ncbi:GNAT family N-acetyltransferase [Arthrobacter sp. YAF16]|uniref:GNAT family N-acetyltransferase n=1 Tax=Arthrobacter sp. YAF16 TaxID=3233076 RepID=UPI003F8E5106